MPPRVSRRFSPRFSPRFPGAVVFAVAGLALSLGACASTSKTIPGTQVPESSENRAILKVLENYRTAVEQRDAPTLVAMASPRYWEDSGTPTGSDDYGHAQLRDVLVGKYQKASAIRFSMKYVGFRRKGPRAEVDVMIDASYSIETARGTERRDMRDQNQLVLEWDGRRWLFLSGM